MPPQKTPRKARKNYPSALHLKPSVLLSQTIFPAHAIPNFYYHISPSKLGWLITSNWVALKHSHSSDACRRILSHDDRVIHSSWWFGEEMQTRTEPRPLPVSWRGVLYRRVEEFATDLRLSIAAAATGASRRCTLDEILSCKLDCQPKNNYRWRKSICISYIERMCTISEI